jgi:hypothetical protein
MEKEFKTTKGNMVIYNEGSENEFRDKVEDDAFYEEEYNGSGVDFVDVVQLIRWENEDYGIRICYYWREHGTVNWKFSIKGLSTSISSILSIIHSSFSLISSIHA